MILDCKTVPFFSPNQRTTRVRGGDWCEMRGRAGLEKRKGREKKGLSSLKPRLLHTSVALEWFSALKVTAGELDVVASDFEMLNVNTSCKAK